VVFGATFSRVQFEDEGYRDADVPLFPAQYGHVSPATLEIAGGEGGSVSVTLVFDGSARGHRVFNGLQEVEE
jgi:hypothetical protein